MTQPRNAVYVETTLQQIANLQKRGKFGPYVILCGPKLSDKMLKSYATGRQWKSMHSWIDGISLCQRLMMIAGIQDIDIDRGSTFLPNQLTVIEAKGWKPKLTLKELTMPGKGHKFTAKQDRAAHHIMKHYEPSLGKKEAERIGYATENAQKKAERGSKHKKK